MREIDAFTDLKELLGSLWVHFLIDDPLGDPIEDQAEESPDGYDDGGIEAHHRQLQCGAKEGANYLLIVNYQDHVRWFLGIGIYPDLIFLADLIGPVELLLLLTVKGAFLLLRFV